jgi:hypothetical protein
VQTLAKLLRIRMNLTPEEFVTIWESGMIPAEVQASTPLACLPYGDSDGNEAQTQMFLNGKLFDHQDLLPALIGIDPRLTALSTQEEIAANACTTLINLITAFTEIDHVVMDSWIEAGFDFLQRALYKWVFTTHTPTTWQDISSDLVAAQCFGGICAYNRGTSSIVLFVETLAVERFSDRHQSAAALLPVLVAGILENNPQKYARLSEFLKQEDPKRLVEDWIALANPQGLDHIIRALCIGTFRLFENSGMLKDVKPVLALMASSADAPKTPTSTDTRRSTT